MRFEEVYAGWQGKRLTQQEAGDLLGVSVRTFRRQIGRFEAEGIATSSIGVAALARRAACRLIRCTWQPKSRSPSCCGGESNPCGSHSYPGSRGQQTLPCAISFLIIYDQSYDQ